MNLSLFERRKEMLSKHSSGLSLSENVKELSLKYNITRRALYYDWKIRKHWLPVILGLEDSETVFYELLDQHRELKRLALKEYLQADNSNARVGALRLLRDLNLDFIELLAFNDLASRLESLEEYIDDGV